TGSLVRPSRPRSRPRATRSGSRRPRKRFVQRALRRMLRPCRSAHTAEARRTRDTASARGAQARSRRKLVEFFRGTDTDSGRALRVSRYLPERRVRFSVWDETGTARAAVSLDDDEAARLAPS